MARRKKSDDSFVWLLLFGALGYVGYSYFTGTGMFAQNSNGQSANAQNGSSTANMIQMGSVSTQGPVQIPAGTMLESANP